MGNDSVASGDDSTGWEKETEQVMNLFTAQANAEVAVDEADVAAVNEEVQEWTLLADEEPGREEAANANPAPPPTGKQTELRHVAYQLTNHKTLKEIALELKQAVSGSKRLLFNRLWDCTAMTMVGNNAFNYRHVIVVGAMTNVPKWVILTPKEVPAIEDIDMATGAEEGFFALTNKENAFGGTGANFLMAKNLV